MSTGRCRISTARRFENAVFPCGSTTSIPTGMPSKTSRMSASLERSAAVELLGRVEQLGILERDGRLSQQQTQKLESLLREHALGKLVLEEEHTRQLSSVTHGHAQDGLGVVKGDVGVAA